MKKVILVAVLFLVGVNVASAETIKIYPTDDAMAQLYDTEALTNWSSARNFLGLISKPISTELPDAPGKLALRSDKASGFYRIYRISTTFDLSALPANATITSANLHLYKSPDNNAGAVQVVVSSHSRENPALYQKQDWTIDNFGTDEFARSSLINSQYTVFSFNQSGLNYLSDTEGMATIGMLTHFDFDSQVPTGFIQAATWYSSEAAGTDKDPYLEIEYTVPGEEDEFPLYTQVISDYPSVVETTEWADDVYASGKGALGSYPCGLYVKNCGCALSSLVMSARNAGIDTSIVGDSIDPGNINSYLDSVGGYDSEGSLYWLKAQAYFGRLNSDGKIESRFVSTKQVSSDTMSAIDAALAAENKAVLGYKNGHFVWLPAKEGVDYIVRDPFWYETETANDIAVPSLVKDYNNTFDSARIITINDDPVLLTGIEAHLISQTAEMLFKNSVGQKVGYENGSVLIDLANASYGNTEVVSLDGALVPSGNKNLLVYDAGNEFTIDVVGTGFGTFSLEFLAITETGETKTFTLTGTTIPGVTTTFTFDLETGEVVEQPISYEQFLSVLNKEMVGYTDQQKAFFLKWADKIWSNMTEKTVSQAVKSIEVYQKLFVAKKIESPVIFSVTDLLKSQVK